MAPPNATPPEDPLGGTAPALLVCPPLDTLSETGAQQVVDRVNTLAAQRKTAKEILGDIAAFLGPALKLI
jgi:hypothetical protein